MHLSNPRTMDSVFHSISKLEELHIEYSFVVVCINIEKKQNKFFYCYIFSTLDDSDPHIKLTQNVVYYLRHNSGRIDFRHGGGRDRTGPLPFDDVFKEFAYLYKKYTKNLWGQPYMYKGTPYRLLDIKLPKVIEEPTRPSALLDADVSYFIHYIYQGSYINRWRSIYKSNIISPLGRMSDRSISNARNSLRLLRLYVEKGAETKFIKSGCDRKTVKAFIQDKIEEHTYTVLYNVPTAAYKSKPLSYIDSLEKIEEYESHIDDIETISPTILRQFIDANVVYDTFKYDLSVALGDPWGDDDSNRFELETIEMLMKTLGPTHSKYKLKLDGVYKLSIRESFKDPVEEEDFYNTINHKLLFHGTTLSNLGSILTHGLVIPPMYKTGNGTTLGKGIYFADCITKSFQYTINKSSKPTGISYILVCEVALGESKDVVMLDDECTYIWNHMQWYDILKYEKDPVPDGFDSKFAIGQHSSTFTTIDSNELFPTEPSRKISVPHTIYEGDKKYSEELRKITNPPNSQSLTKYLRKKKLALEEVPKLVPIDEEAFKDKTSFNYNEYCIYKKHRCKIRYIFQIAYELL